MAFLGPEKFSELSRNGPLARRLIHWNASFQLNSELFPAELTQPIKDDQFAHKQLSHAVRQN